MDINKAVSNKTFKWTMLVMAELILMALVFSAGIRIGIRKANFSFAFGANYERNFAGPARGAIRFGSEQMSAGFREPGNDFRNAHGLAGAIVSLNGNTIIVKDRDGKENTINVDERTLIKSHGGDLKISDLKNDDQIVVMGKPDNNGAIDADFIRVFDNSNNPSNTNINPGQGN